MPDKRWKHNKVRTQKKKIQTVAQKNINPVATLTKGKEKKNQPNVFYSDGETRRWPHLPHRCSFTTIPVLMRRCCERKGR